MNEYADLTGGWFSGILLRARPSAPAWPCPCRCPGEGFLCSLWPHSTIPGRVSQVLGSLLGASPTRSPHCLPLTILRISAVLGAIPSFRSSPSRNINTACLTAIQNSRSLTVILPSSHTLKVSAHSTTPGAFAQSPPQHCQGTRASHSQAVAAQSQRQDYADDDRQNPACSAIPASFSSAALGAQRLFAVTNWRREKN